MTVETLMPTQDRTVPAAPLVDETTARRVANGYLSRAVGIPFGAVTGVYIPMTVPIWQFAIEFRLPRLGRLAIMGTIDVNAETGEPQSLTPNEIKKIQDRANVIVQFYTQKTAA